MAIKNKDGTVYRLRGPNPLMNEQKEWDKNKVQLYNLGYKSEVILDSRNPIKEQEANVVTLKEKMAILDRTTHVSAKDFMEEITLPEPEPVVVPEVLHVNDTAAKYLQQKGVQYHCAPATGVRKHTDDLYGNSYNTTVYGQPFVFDAIVTEEADFQLQFWCVRAISKDSIVYQKAKSGVWESRWWRVGHIQPKSQGYLITATISDTNPDFS